MHLEKRMQRFSTTWFAWYICGVSTLLALAASLITIVPPGEWVGLLLCGSFLGFAVMAGITAFFLGRRPPSHWANQSRPINIGMAAVAILLTVLMILVF